MVRRSETRDNQEGDVVPKIAPSCGAAAATRRELREQIREFSATVSAGAIRPRCVLTKSFAQQYFSPLEFQLVLTIGEVVVVLDHAARVGEAGRLRTLIRIRGMPQSFDAARTLMAFPSQHSL